jgi:hypothetical protein
MNALKNAADPVRRRDIIALAVAWLELAKRCEEQSIKRVEPSK